MIEKPQLPCRMLSWMKTRIPSKTVISGPKASWMTLAKMKCIELVGPSIAHAKPAVRPCLQLLKQTLVRHRVEPTVAPRVAPQKPPGPEREPAQDAELPYRRHRVRRARGLVLAPPRQRGGD